MRVEPGTSTQEPENMYIVMFFNEEHWAKAKWKGMYYEIPPNDVPRVGICFEDAEAGSMIFKEWQDRFGKVDQFDELRISFVLGPIDGQGPGYSVVLSPDLPGILQRYMTTGVRPVPHIRRSHFLEIARCHRMRGSEKPEWRPEVERFRDMYRRGAPFLFGPAHVSAILGPSGAQQAIFDTERAIRKYLCYFRKVSDVQEGQDIEACIYQGHTAEE